MIISSFTLKPAPQPIQSIIKQLFENRTHRRIKVDRSDFTLAPLPPDTLRKQYSQFSHQSNFSEQQTQDPILQQSRPILPNLLKQKIIKKQVGKHQYAKEQKEINKKYNHYLLNYLHKTNLLLVKDHIPPNLSVLETIDEGDYLQNDDNTLYERKDFPHYSNVILPQNLPIDNNKCVFIKHFQKIRQEEVIFQMDDNCVIKIKQVSQFIGILFKRSIQFCKKMKRFRSGTPGEVIKGETENHDFEAIAETMGIHFRAAKLLYDMLNSFFDFQREMLKGEQSKLRASTQIKESIRQILSTYSSNSCIHIPHQEQYISLRELRSLLINKMLEQMQARQ